MLKQRYLITMVSSGNKKGDTMYEKQQQKIIEKQREVIDKQNECIKNYKDTICELMNESLLSIICRKTNNLLIS